jgi:hypothetical protein
LNYRYPAWWFLDAEIFADIGNAFNGRFDRFHFKRMVLDFGFGFSTVLSRVDRIEVLLAFGSNQLQSWNDEGFDVDNFRFVFGASHGF